MYGFKEIESDAIKEDDSNEISLKKLDTILHKINKINEIKLNVIVSFC